MVHLCGYLVKLVQMSECLWRRQLGDPVVLMSPSPLLTEGNVMAPIAIYTASPNLAGTDAEEDSKAMVLSPDPSVFLVPCYGNGSGALVGV